MTDRELEPLDRELQDMFAAERDRPEMRNLDRQRLLARVSATLGAGPGGEPGPGAPPTAGPAGPAPAAGAGSGALLGKVGAGVLAVAAIVGAALYFSSGAEGGPVAANAAPAEVRPVESQPSGTPLEPIAPSAAAPQASATAAPAAEAIPSPVAAPTSSAEARPAQSSPTAGSTTPLGGSARAETAPPGRDSDLAAERAVLDEARSSVSRGSTGAAIAALERHAREFPRGRLSEEREALWIQALIGAGRLDEARSRASRFKKTYPRSMLLQSFESALGSIP